MARLIEHSSVHSLHDAYTAYTLLFDVCVFFSCNLFAKLIDSRASTVTEELSLFTGKSSQEEGEIGRANEEEQELSGDCERVFAQRHVWILCKNFNTAGQ